MTAFIFTPPKLARRWNVKPHHIGSLIRSGELKAFSISLKPGGNPPKPWNVKTQERFVATLKASPLFRQAVREAFREQ